LREEPNAESVCFRAGRQNLFSPANVLAKAISKIEAGQVNEMTETRQISSVNLEA
jgi:hypothetical protein